MVRFGLFTAALLTIKFSLRGETMAKVPLSFEHTDDANKRPVTGRSGGPGFTITWEGSQTPDAAAPADVLKAVKYRMEHLQKGATGSDRNARALWNVMQAIDVLEGKEVIDAGVGSPGAGFSAPKG